jgi:hypothetical protein
MYAPLTRKPETGICVKRNLRETKKSCERRTLRGLGGYGNREPWPALSRLSRRKPKTENSDASENPFPGNSLCAVLVNIISGLGLEVRRTAERFRVNDLMLPIAYTMQKQADRCQQLIFR